MFFWAAMPCEFVGSKDTVLSPEDEGSMFIRIVGVLPTSLHGVTIHKNIIAIFTVIRTSDLTLLVA
jgi:hypothetical protein